MLGYTYGIHKYLKDNEYILLHFPYASVNSNPLDAVMCLHFGGIELKGYKMRICFFYSISYHITYN